MRISPTAVSATVSDNTSGVLLTPIAAASRCLEIDRVHAGAVVDDRFQVGQRRDGVGVDAGTARRHHDADVGRVLPEKLGPSRTVGSSGIS